MNKFYRVVTFQSKEVIDTLLRNKFYLADINKLREGSICEEDIKACDGKTPIWVFQHPAFCFEGIGTRQFCDMMRTLKEEMSVSTLKDYYMIELHLAKQPPVGVAYNDYNCACVIPEINLDDVAAIYKVVSSGANCVYALDVVKTFKNNTLFKDNVSFDYDMQMNDNLPTLSLDKFKSVSYYYIYESVLYAYTLSVVGSAYTDLFITNIINELPKHRLDLRELYEEVTKIMNSEQEKVTDYQKLVRDCYSKSDNTKSLATALYNEWVNLGSTDKDLIGIYKAMYEANSSVSTIYQSTYELEYLTKKRLVIDEQGYSLEDCSNNINVDLGAGTKSDDCKRNANALGILSTYKNKYNISDTLWSSELERLKSLCGSTDIYGVANFVETHFL